MRSSRFWLRLHEPIGRLLHTITILVPLSACPSLAAAEPTADLGLLYFDKQYYEEAAPLLEQRYQKSGKLTDAKILATTYFRLLNHELAIPLLNKVLAEQPADIESRLMLAEILLEQKQYRASDPHTHYLARHAGEHYMSWILLARRYTSKREIAKAIRSYEHACRLNPDATVPYSVELLMLYIESGDKARARTLARRVISRSPEAFEVSEIKNRLEAMTDLARQTRFLDTPYTLQLGYLLESDDHLLVEPDRPELATDYQHESDYRHVLTFKAKGKRPLGRGRELYGEARLYQSLHNQRDEYNQLRQYYMGGMHWSLGKYGIRLPYTYTHADLDKQFYHQSHALSPEFYWSLDNTTTLHGQLRLTLNDYRDSEINEEQRSGKTTGASLYYRHSFQKERGQASYMYTLSQTDSNGDNWDYQEQLLSAYFTYYYSKRVVGRLNLSYGLQDFAHTHSTLDIMRDDRYSNTSASLAYWMDRNIELIANWMWIDRNSTIELYDYTRRVVGIGLTWHL